MTTNDYNFTLIIDGDADQHLDELFDAGCDDAMFGVTDGVQYAEFDREADSLPAAIMSAIEAVESVDGLRVVRVEPDDLVTMSEIAERLGQTRESIRLQAAGKRGHSFPAPVSHSRARNRLWRWSTIAVWANTAVTDKGRADARFVAALNSVLELRTQIALMDESERQLLGELVTV